MSTAIPTSTSISESAVISAPLAQVWHLIKLQEFDSFWSKLEKSEHVKGASPETDVVKWTFKDGTVLDVKQEEHSKRRLPSAQSPDDHQLYADDASHRQANGIHNTQTINNYITYSVIASTPALSYTSVLSTIRCYAVTSGPHEGSTFVQWSANFSSDADAGVIEDARFKRTEALADLASVVGKK
ncbi:MAG: hypothetical protein HETSPECPRED_005741 [Heterodermia speciosa]|uniref:Bet v1-like protein n=1 Tax=Heterodermia speciosa TaxID=116794 RepID=A0A8H3FH43_9LECA|nr:MAG: hypothetical protein HETSPECPRED_005741 [Heterodermia speciosa]